MGCKSVKFNLTLFDLLCQIMIYIQSNISLEWEGSEEGKTTIIVVFTAFNVIRMDIGL